MLTPLLRSVNDRAERAKEHFGYSTNNKVLNDVLKVLVVLALVFASAWGTKYLWNKVLVPKVGGVSKLSNITEALGMMVLIRLLFFL